LRGEERGKGRRGEEGGGGDGGEEDEERAEEDGNCRPWRGRRSRRNMTWGKREK